ncbi:MAG: hypothetical protein AAGE59_37355 [Cyanobacteria bacterium P01_F01_bin.86]
MNITQLIFLRPRETSHTDKDEGHSLEISLLPLQPGDIRRWDGQVWHIAFVEAYTSTRETNNGFSVAVLTPDGAAAHPPLRQIGDQRLMYLCISSEDFALAWPEPDECLPEVGAEAPPLDGWRVERIQEFVGDVAGSLYNRVLVCWCVAISAASEQTAA